MSQYLVGVVYVSSVPGRGGVRLISTGPGWCTSHQYRVGVVYVSSVPGRGGVRLISTGSGWCMSHQYQGGGGVCMPQYEGQMNMFRYQSGGACPNILDGDMF